MRPPWDLLRRWARDIGERPIAEVPRHSIGHGSLVVDGRTIAEDAEVTIAIDAGQITRRPPSPAALRGDLELDDGPVGEATVQPIPAPTECWRCWAPGVDEGDELGLCDRCKADLQGRGPRSIPSEGDPVVVHELYAWQSEEPVATVRHRASEDCARCGIRVETADGLRGYAGASEQHLWGPAVDINYADDTVHVEFGTTAEEEISAAGYARGPITPDPDARPSEHTLQRMTTTDRRGCFIPRSEAEEFGFRLPQELALEAGVEYRMQWRETEDGFFVEVWTF